LDLVFFFGSSFTSCYCFSFCGILIAQKHGSPLSPPFFPCWLHCFSVSGHLFPKEGFPSPPCHCPPTFFPVLLCRRLFQFPPLLNSLTVLPPTDCCLLAQFNSPLCQLTGGLYSFYFSSRSPGPGIFCFFFPSTAVPTSGKLGFPPFWFV